MKSKIEKIFSLKFLSRVDIESITIAFTVKRSVNIPRQPNTEDFSDTSIPHFPPKFGGIAC